MLEVLRLYATLSDILILCDRRMYVADKRRTVLYSAAVPYEQLMTVGIVLDDMINYLTGGTAIQEIELSDDQTCIIVDKHERIPIKHIYKTKIEVEKCRFSTLETTVGFCTTLMNHCVISGRLWISSEEKGIKLVSSNELGHMVSEIPTTWEMKYVPISINIKYIRYICLFLTLSDYKINIHLSDIYMKLFLNHNTKDPIEIIFQKT